MKTLYACALALALASCKGSEVAATKEPAAPRPPQEYSPAAPPAPGVSYLDKQIAESDKFKDAQNKGVVARTLSKLGIVQDEKKASDSKTFINPTSVPRKCKGCTFVNGDNNKVAGDTKVKGGAVSDGGNAANAGKGATQATDSSTAISSQGGAVAAGPNASAQGGATRPDALSPLATVLDNLTGPVGYVLAALVLGGIVYGIYAWRRGKRAAGPLVCLLLLLACSCSRPPAPTRWEQLPGALTRAQLDSLSQYNY